MLFPEKQVQVTMSVDMAYEILGRLSEDLSRGVVLGGCKSSKDDLPGLVKQYKALCDNLLFSIEAHGYCEHIEEAAMNRRGELRDEIPPRASRF